MRAFRKPIVDGMDPVMEFWSRLMDVSEERRPIVDGMDPVMEL